MFLGIPFKTFTPLISGEGQSSKFFSFILDCDEYRIKSNLFLLSLYQVLKTQVLSQDILIDINSVFLAIRSSLPTHGSEDTEWKELFHFRFSTSMNYHLNTVLLVSSIHIPMKDRHTRNISVLGYRHHMSPSVYMDLAAFAALHQMMSHSAVQPGWWIWKNNVPFRTCILR